MTMQVEEKNSYADDFTTVITDCTERGFFLASASREMAEVGA